MSKFETWQVVLMAASLFLGPAIGTIFGLQGQIIFDWLKNRGKRDIASRIPGNGDIPSGALQLKSVRKHLQEQSEVRYDLTFVREHCVKNSANIQQLLSGTRQYQESSQAVFVQILEELRRLNHKFDRSQAGAREEA